MEILGLIPMPAKTSVTFICGDDCTYSPGELSSCSVHWLCLIVSAMITLKIICNTGRTGIANFSGTYDDAKSYFLNRTFHIHDENGIETQYRCARIAITA